MSGPPSSSWQLNGSATPLANGVQLTAATANQAGSAFYKTAVPTNNAQIDFDLNMSGGSGADGATFTLANPTAPATS
ncbi:hypothetical protein ABTD52_18185, partial [Acinetobacter baumannii]